MKKEKEILCIFCRNYKASPRSLRAHWCKQNPTRGNKSSAKLSHEQWQACIDAGTCNHPDTGGKCTSPDFCKSIGKCRFGSAPSVKSVAKKSRFKLTPQIRFEIIQSALHHFSDNHVTKEARRLHAKHGYSQVDAIKEVLGIAGAGDKHWSWDNYASRSKGLRVNYSKDLIIPWSDLIPYVWPTKPKPLYRPKSKLQPSSAWSVL